MHIPFIFVNKALYKDQIISVEPNFIQEEPRIIKMSLDLLLKQLLATFRSMEAAALVYRDMKDLDKACDLVEKASLLYLEHGTPDTAALALDRAAKSVSRTMTIIFIVYFGH